VTKKPIIVLVGESANDRAVMRVLFEAFCPASKGRIVQLDGKFPLRAADDTNLSSRVDHLVRLVNARAAREGAAAACVLVHEDLDATDSEEYDAVHKRVQDALTRAFQDAHYALAVWETEAWLLLFPRALAAFASAWTVPAQYRGKDTGKIQDPKRVLRHSVSKSGPRYRESDAPSIAERAVQLGLHNAPAGTNRSYDAFRAYAATIRIDS
jgi:hypothetical protein